MRQKYQIAKNGDKYHINETTYYFAGRIELFTKLWDESINRITGEVIKEKSISKTLSFRCNKNEVNKYTLDFLKNYNGEEFAMNQDLMIYSNPQNEVFLKVIIKEILK